MAGLALAAALATAAPAEDCATRLRAAVDAQRFIHIPRTGGTSLEFALGAARSPPVHAGANLARLAGVGAYAALMGVNLSDWARPESVNGRRRNLCVPWHVPPQRFVPKSFTIVRDQYDRLVSEFNYRAGKDAVRGALGTGLNCTCTAFAEWLVDRLEREVRLRGHSACHFVPAAVYARSAAVLVPFESLSAFSSLLGVRALARELPGRSGCLPAAPRCQLAGRLIDAAYAADVHLRDLLLRRESRNHSCVTDDGAFPLWVHHEEGGRIHRYLRRLTLCGPRTFLKRSRLREGILAPQAYRCAA